MILDNNIIIYSKMPEYDKIRKFLAENTTELSVSTITKLEVLVHNKLTLDEKNIFNNFFKAITILPIKSLIIDTAIKLSQDRKMSFGNSLIAASALVNNQKIFTNNVKDFEEIPNLSIISMNSIQNFKN